MPLYELAGKQPVLADDVWVAPSADVIGEAQLGEAVTVWFGAVIRADNTPIRLGAHTNIQDGALLHSDPGALLTIGAGVTVGHHAILHGCTVGDNVLIGMGARVLNHAIIGDNCLVGAGALVTEGKIFPPGSLIVGAPAKVVRELTEKEITDLKASADSYVAKGKDFAAGLLCITDP